MQSRYDDRANAKLTKIIMLGKLKLGVGHDVSRRRRIGRLLKPKDFGISTLGPITGPLNPTLVKLGFGIKDSIENLLENLKSFQLPKFNIINLKEELADIDPNKVTDFVKLLTFFKLLAENL